MQKAFMPDKKPDSNPNRPQQDSPHLKANPKKIPEDPAFADVGNSEQSTQTSSPIASVPSEAEKKKDSSFLRFLKRIAYSIWAVVMAIGMVIAFLISLFLV